MERLTHFFDEGYTSDLSPKAGKPKVTVSEEKLNALVNKLADYENAEEEGLLLKLPCRHGGTAFCIEGNSVHSHKITGYEITSTGAVRCYSRLLCVGVVGETVFGTEEDAKKVLLWRKQKLEEEKKKGERKK